MKKTLAILLALALVFSSITVAFAEETLPVDAQAAKDLGMLKGDKDGVTLDYLKTTPQRIQAAILFLRLKGLEDDALAFTGTENFADADKAAWAKPIMAYLKANPELGWVGDGKNFNPTGLVDAAQYYKVMLETLGYKQTTTAVVGDFLYSDTLKFAAEKGLLKVAAVTNYTINDLATATIEALEANVKGVEKTLAVSLIDAKVITEAQAIAAGVYVAPPVVATLDVKSAVALSSKVIEVKLNTAANAAADGYELDVLDAAGTSVLATSVEIAAYDATGKTVLVTLAADTTAGTLYKFVSGTTSVNFGGVGKDETKPTATVSSTDYNEVTVTFSEPVDAKAIAFSAAEKYGSKAALNVTLKEIKSSTVVVFTSDAQKSATLYATVISGAKDFAGNTMDKDETKTFVGNAMKTDKQGLNTVTVIDSKTIVVGYDVKVDQATALVPANYVIAEKYGSKTAVAVVAAEMNLDANDDVVPTEVKLTLGADTKSGTLYGLEVANVGTLYGYALNTDDDTLTFVGKDKDTKKPSVVTVASDSNTQITVSFSDENGTDNLAADVDYSLVTITEKYGTKAALALTFKEVKDNTIVFTTAAQKAATLYEVTVAAGVKDKLGNVTTDKLTTNFVGSGIADKITSITAITDSTATTGKIRVTFDKNYGAGGLDVASYFIDGGIGYPTKVEAVTGAGNGNKVDLTIVKTSTGSLYKLTVKGVANSDGVAMATDGINKTFVGTGGAPVTATKLEAAVALNDQTMILYFNKDVKDISGLDKTSAANLANEVTLVGAVGVPTQAFIDSENTKAMVVYTTTAGGFENAAGTTVTVQVTSAGLDANNDEVVMAENTTAPTAIKVDGVVAVNAKTLNVYFNQPIRFLANGFASVNAGANAITGVRALNAANTLWEVSLTTDLTNTQYTFDLAAFDNTKISAIASGVTLIGLDTTTTYAFAGNATADLYVKDVYAVATDSRTIKVIYPEDMDITDMDGTDALNVANYTVYDAVTGGNNVTNGRIALAVWDDATNTVTLTTNGDFNASTTGYFLRVANTVKNALGTKTVKTSLTADLSTQVALSTAAPAKLLVKSVSVTGQTITVKFNQQFKTAANVVVAAGNATELVKYLKLTVNTSTVLADTNITDVVAKLGTTPEANSNTGFVDTLEITVAGGTLLTLNGQGTVELVNTATATAINGQVQDTTMTPVIFAQK